MTQKRKYMWDANVFIAYRCEGGHVWVREEMPTGDDVLHGPFTNFADAFEQCFDTSYDSAVWRIECRKLRLID